MATTTPPQGSPANAPAASPPQLKEFTALTDAQLVERYRRGVENFDQRVLKLTDEQLDTAFLPDAGVGRWPARVLLGHLADAELVFVHRMRRAVAEDQPVFAVWDENAFLDAGLYGPGKEYPAAGFIATIHTLRKWTSEWLSTLEPVEFGRKALHPERGEQTVRLILAYATWHLEHHNWYLRKKLERFSASF